MGLPGSEFELWRGGGLDEPSPPLPPIGRSAVNPSPPQMGHRRCSSWDRAAGWSSNRQRWPCGQTNSGGIPFVIIEVHPRNDNPHGSLQRPYVSLWSRRLESRHKKSCDEWLTAGSCGATPFQQNTWILFERRRHGIVSLPRELSLRKLTGRRWEEPLHAAIRFPSRPGLLVGGIASRVERKPWQGVESPAHVRKGWGKLNPRGPSVTDHRAAANTTGSGTEPRASESRDFQVVDMF